MRHLKAAVLGAAITLGISTLAIGQEAMESACPATTRPAAPTSDTGEAARPPGIVMAQTVTPSDTSTSVVISPDTTDQITCGTLALETTSDVLYSSEGKELRMDILVPAGEGPKPLIIYVPGGGFVMAMKEQSLELRTFVAEAGFVVASIQYRTALDGATYRDGIADVKSAVRYLRAHADEYGIDTDRIGLWGESAGGYMVAMAGVTNGDTSFDMGDNLDQSSAVQAVVNKFGATDVSTLGADFDEAAKAAYAEPATMIARYINGPGTTESTVTDPTAHTTANALTYVDGDEPPFLIFHGSDDRIISPSQTLMLHDALIAAGDDSTRYVLEGANHGDMGFLGDPLAGLPWSTNEVMDLITGFFAEM